MTDQESTAPADEKPADAPEPEAKADEAKTFDKEYVASLRSESAQRRKENQALKERLEELEERDKSELERALSKATKAEQAKAEAESRLTRFEVAAEKQIPAEAVDLLNGTSREELEASADKILNLVKSRTESEKAPDFDGGAREPAEDADPGTAHNRQIAELIFGASQRT
jgi:vacuolar-type H+-ATPase subunit I/STV1